MKLKVIAGNFQTLTQVFDSIEKFERSWELIPAYKELKEAVELFEKKRQELFEKYKDMNSPDFQKEINDLIETDIKIKQPLRFSKKEIEDSKIKNSQKVAILDFMI